MIVRRLMLAGFALLAACWSGGCSDRDRSPLPPEVEDPYYVQGKQLQKQGRHAEALNAFLKVIDRRGEAPSPESHLEAGLLCLYQTRDFPAAYYHLRRYHRAQPNSKEAPLVLGKIEEAKREFARTLPGRPLEDQSVRLALDEEVGRLRRENEELRAAPPVIPPPVTAVAGPAGLPAALPARPAEPGGSVRPGLPPLIQPAPRPAVPAAAAAARPAGRSHTVAAKETLYGLSRRYGVSVEAIVAANPAALPRASTPLKIGMVLRIP